MENDDLVDPVTDTELDIDMHAEALVVTAGDCEGRAVVLELHEESADFDSSAERLAEPLAETERSDDFVALAVDVTDGHAVSVGTAVGVDPAVFDLTADTVTNDLLLDGDDETDSRAVLLCTEEDVDCTDTDALKDAALL